MEYNPIFQTERYCFNMSVHRLVKSVVIAAEKFRSAPLAVFNRYHQLSLYSVFWLLSVIFPFYYWIHRYTSLRKCANI